MISFSISTISMLSGQLILIAVALESPKLSDNGIMILSSSWISLGMFMILYVFIYKYHGVVK
jgi:hypothetical protein